MPRPIYSSIHWILGWEGPTVGLNILEALAGIEQSLGRRAGSLGTLPTDLPRLRSDDENSGYAGSHPGSHLSYCRTGFWFNYFIPLGKCLELNDRILTSRLQFHIHESPCTTLPYVFWSFNNRKYTRTVRTCSCLQPVPGSTDHCVVLLNFNGRQDRQHRPMCCDAEFQWQTGQAAQTNVLCCWISMTNRTGSTDHCVVLLNFNGRQDRQHRPLCCAVEFQWQTGQAAKTIVLSCWISMADRTGSTGQCVVLLNEA